MNKQLISLLLKVSPDSKINGCWIWAASKNQDGYGKLADGHGGWIFAHRVAWEIFNGPIPNDMEICHECDTPACVNPTHMFLGTHAENMLDCKVKGRANGSSGAKNGRAKLTPSDVLAIRRSGLSHGKLAEKFSVSATLIRYIRIRKAWASLPEEDASVYVEPT